MLVRELFPELAKQILHDLRKLKRHDLSAQIMELQVLDRCRCGAEICGSFSTQEAGSLKQRIGIHGTDIMLECGATVTVRGGRIVAIETLDPRVTAALREAIP